MSLDEQKAHRGVEVREGSARSVIRNGRDALGRFDFIYGLLQREDYWACEQTQRTLRTGANKTLIFGRQEIPLHRLHESCAAHMEAAEMTP